MIELRDSQNNAADFDDQGRLVLLRSRGQEWRFIEPGPGCAVVLKREGREVLARPAAPAIHRFAATRDAARFVFEELRLDDGQRAAGEVVVEWRLRDGLLHGRMAVSGLDPNAGLYALAMPDVAFDCLDPAHTSLIVPRELGCVIRRAADQLFAGRDAVTIENAQFQCFGWAEGERGLYLDTRDSRGWVKRWRLRRAGERGVRFQTLCLAPQDGRTEFELPYEATLAGFSGDWYELGQIYRTWALEAPWARRGPQERKDSFLAKLSCWLWNRGAIDRVCPPAKELARRIGEPVALDWYWWHKHGYDTEYPDYFPPREGEERFRAAVRDLQASDVFVQVYTNGVAYDRDGGMWDAIGPGPAIVQENGEILSPAYNRFTNHRLAHACGDSPEWRSIVVDFARRAHALGLDGLYLDMIAIAGGVRPCYNPAHAHAPGGGCYGVQGFRELLRQVRDARPGFPISSESVQEQYLDLLDAGIVVSNSAERFAGYGDYLGCEAEPIPLFQAIYHGRMVCFGNYALIDGVPPFDDLWPAEFKPDPKSEKDWPALCPDQFAFELARTTAFGCQPMACNLTSEHLRDPRLEADVEFLVAVARCYAHHKEYLLWGDMLPPGKLRCRTLDVRFLRRFIFTRPGEETFVTRAFPAVLHSAWQAPDAESALLLLINYTREPTAVEYEPPPSWAPAPDESSGLRFDGRTLAGALPARCAAAVRLARA